MEQPSSNETESSYLLNRKNTVLVLVDFQVEFLSCFEDAEVDIVKESLENFLRAAVDASVPVVSTLIHTNRFSAIPLNSLDNRHRTIEYCKRATANPWNDPIFEKTIATMAKPRLLLAGLSLEISLSFTALGALERGYDVYVVRDVCLSQTEQGSVAAYDRLMQAGCVPVSWRQVVVEWHQLGADLGALRRVLKTRRRIKKTSIDK